MGGMWDEYTIVDDNKFDRLICNRIIRRQDHDAPIHEFESGKETLEFLVSSQNNSKDMLMFLDINMPEMSGYKFIEELNHFINKEEIVNRLTIILMSSSPRSEDAHYVESYDFVKGFLKKPMEIEKAMNMIRK